MQLINYDELLYGELDILKEIGSIGMGHASTSISQMLNMKVTMSIPEVYALEYDAATEYLKLMSADSLGVIINLQGDSEGMLLQVLSKKFAVQVINFFFQSELETIDDPDEMSLSVIQEIGNITAGAYCNALAGMTGMFIDISTPTYCPNLKETVIDGRRQSQRNKKLLIVSNSFFTDKTEIKSNFLFMPDENTIMDILTKLKQYYGLAE